MIFALRPAVHALGGDGWTAIAAIGAWVAAFATILYVIFTVKLWRAAAAQVTVQRRVSEANLMQSLMEQYDKLRPEISLIQRWHMEAAAGGGNLAERFDDERGVDGTDESAIDDARFAVSRLFVRTRKLAEAHYLSDEIVAKALGGQAIEDVFLRLVDPLDAVIAGPGRGRADERYYRDLLRRFPRPVNVTRSVSGE